MFNLLAVFIGGGLGSCLRYLANVTLPFPTAIVNILGSFVIGFLHVWLMQKLDLPPYYKPLLTVGLCGGLTTFSTFSLEIVKFLDEGNYLHASGYILFSVIICVLSAGIGVYFARNLFV